MSEGRPKASIVPKSIVKKAQKIATGPLLASVEPPAVAAPIEETARIQTLGNFLAVRAALGIGQPDT